MHVHVCVCVCMCVCVCVCVCVCACALYYDKVNSAIGTAIHLYFRLIQTSLISENIVSSTWQL